MSIISNTKYGLAPNPEMALAQMLNDLIEKINIISRQKTLDVICQMASRHVVEIFNLDYALISLFDFKERKIVSQEKGLYVNPQKDLGINNPHNWIKDSKYNEKDDDILIRVFQAKRNVKAIGKYIFDESKNDGGHHQTNKISFSSLNEKIFFDYDHKKLGRFYIPIIYRAPIIKDDNIDLCIGVIEIGFQEQIEGQFSNVTETEALTNFQQLLMQKYPNPELLEHLLQLYTDNFAQPCYIAIVEDEANSLIEQLKKIEEAKDTYSGLSHNAYATEVIKRISIYLKADCGVIAFKTFQNNYINYIGKGAYYSNLGLLQDLDKEILNGQNENRQIILAHHLNSTHSSYYSDNISQCKKKYLAFLKLPEPIRSELVTPICLEDDIVGIVNLYSTTRGFFNLITISIIEKSMKLFISTYLLKKRQNVYNNLIKPTEAWNHSKDVYRQIIKLLTDYYNTDAICLWVRNPTNSQENEYVLEEGVAENENFISLITGSISKNFLFYEEVRERMGSDIDLHYDFKKDNSISRFCKNNNFTFYISINIKILNRYEVFINIFSKLDIFSSTKNSTNIKKDFLSNEYEFLTHLSTKISISLQNLRITNSLKEMSEFKGPITGDNPRINLRKIVENAQIATGADIVCLFPFFTEKREISKKDGILSNGYVNKSVGKAEFADLILNRRTNDDREIYNFDSNEECKEFLLSCDPTLDITAFDKTSFRAVNNIKSTSAARLNFGAESVGVMFFNYKENQNLKENNTLREIILFFSTFAAYQIYLNRELNSITTLNKELDIKYADKQNEIEKMIPLITRTQFYLIVEGVSHIMKNALEGIANDLDDITYLNGKDKHHFDTKKRNIENSLDLIETVLTIFNFRDKQNKKVFVSIIKIINATIKFFKIRHGKINYKNPPEVPIPDFLCYQAEFAMIIYNLIYNSITAIDTIKRTEGEIEIIVGLSKDETSYIITIKDNGIGIKHELDERIYEPNFTTKSKGTGLGLYYVRQTLENYNGTISHRSIYKEYAKFTLTIPLANNYN